MPVFSVGDIVQIVRQPEGMLPLIIGEVGYIEEISGAYARFNGFNLDGSFSGCGSVSLDSLELETSAQWKQAKETRDANSARSLAKGLERGERIRVGIAKIAAQQGLSVGTVEVIYQEVLEIYENS